MRHFKRILVGLLLLVLIGLPAQAQKSRKKSTGQLRERGLVNSYESGASDGMSIRILLETDRLTPVRASRVFRTGERIRIEFKNNFDGYAYIVNVTPGGKKRVLFPHGSETDNRIVANHAYSQSLTFDEEKGTETLEVIMSRVPIPVLHVAINTLNGELNDSQSAAVAQSTTPREKPAASVEGGIDVRESSSAIATEDGPAIASRGLTIVAGKRKGENIAIATTDASDGTKIGDKEARSFVIRLRHN
jgi:hypothetical protein